VIRAGDLWRSGEEMSLWVNRYRNAMSAQCPPDSDRATCEPCGPQADFGGPSRSRGSFKRFRGYSHQCHLLESGESLGALWTACYPDSGNERKRVLGVPRCPQGPTSGQASLARAQTPHLDCHLKRSTLWTGGLRSTQYPKIYPLIIPSPSTMLPKPSLCFSCALLSILCCLCSQSYDELQFRRTQRSLG
jgi:hypothetical protein